MTDGDKMLTLKDNLLIFTDLDGSLLDHDSYSWQAAQPWLGRLSAARIPLVIASSKTAAEIAILQQRLGLSAFPFIAENGAQIVFPPGWRHPARIFGADYAAIVNALHRLHASFAFRGFADADDATVAQWCGFTPQEARLARQRAGSEPLCWLDDQQQLAHFRHALAQQRLTLTRGGRFYHVMGRGVSKGRAARWLIRYYQRRHQRPFTTLALGDGPNDLPLLQSADYAVLIRALRSEPLPLPATRRGRLYRSRQTGPAGWSEGLDHFLLPGKARRIAHE